MVIVVNPLENKIKNGSNMPNVQFMTIFMIGTSKKLWILSLQRIIRKGYIHSMENKSVEMVEKRMD